MFGFHAFGEAPFGAVATDLDAPVESTVTFAQAVTARCFVPAPDLVGGNHIYCHGVPATADHPPFIGPRGGKLSLAEQVHEHERTVEQTVTFGQSAVAQLIANRSASNTVTFGQVLDSNIKFGVASNTVVFGQTASAQIELNVSTENSVQFKHFGWHQIVFANPSNEITFGQSAVAGPNTINKSVEQTVFFNDEANRAILASASNSVVFSQEAARNGTGENDLTLTQAVSQQTGPVAETDLTLTQAVGLNYTLQRSIEQTVTFDQNAYAELVAFCDAGFTPADISLAASGATTLNLKPPTFGDSYNQQLQRALNISRGGSPNLFRRSIWPKNIEMELQFQTLKATEAEAILTFIGESLGKLVTLTDHTGDIWEGIIARPEDVNISENGVDDWSAEINFVGSRT